MSILLEHCYTGKNLILKCLGKKNILNYYFDRFGFQNRPPQAPRPGQPGGAPGGPGGAPGGPPRA